MHIRVHASSHGQINDGSLLTYVIARSNPLQLT